MIYGVFVRYVKVFLSKKCNFRYLINVLKITFYHFRRFVSKVIIIITWHVILHAVAEFLCVICLAFQNAVPLCVCPVVAQFSFRHEKALPFPLRYRDY